MRIARSETMTFYKILGLCSLALAGFGLLAEPVMPFAPLGAEQRGPDLKDVRVKGFPGEKMMRFLERRMLNAQDRQDIFDEARRAFRDRDDDDKLVLDGHRVGGYWRGEFWGKQMLSLARVTDYLGDDRLRREVADECHRLMSYQDADGYLGSYC